jgi:transcriptional regulator with XRE-family HTH domain
MSEKMIERDTSFDFIGIFIRSYRQANRLSLQMLADQSGVSRSMIAQVESLQTSPTLPLLQKLANIMNIELRDLVQAPHIANSIKVSGLSVDNLVSKPESPFVCHQLLRQQNQNVITEVYHFYFRFAGKTSFSANVKGATKNVWLESGSLFLHLPSTRRKVNAKELVNFSASIPHRFESNLEDGLAAGNFFVVVE